MVAAFAIETILARGAFPNGMLGLKLSTKAATVGEWEGTTGTAGRGFFVVVLGHSVPPEVVVASIFYSRGQGNATSAHDVWSIMIGYERTVVEIRVYAGYNSGFSETTPSLSIFHPPTCAFIG